jgi:hypothetical protein
VFRPGAYFKNLTAFRAERDLNADEPALAKARNTLCPGADSLQVKISEQSHNKDAQILIVASH